MSTSDRSIDPRILASAREEFLSKPYEQVSLREICQKAGVTTGAFYNRYKNKEELFDVLVAPTLAKVADYCEQTESFNYDRLDAEDMRRVWDMTAETQRRTVNMLYDDYDGFRLLLCHADGTRYANFIHDFVSDVTARSYRFIEEAYRRGVTPVLIEEEELHMLLTAYWTTMFEPLVHGLSREKALRHSEIVAQLFHWMDILGF
ncbi:MAG: TetR/AcrR family transcriptional regulator [Oscillospiraceae bacterium]|nr:TetR/AcrR family transcriptional regulator [Oscillospiraceae bacterium]